MKLTVVAAFAAFAWALPIGAAAQTPVVDKTFAAGAAKVLQIDAGGGEVTLIPGAADSIRVQVLESGASTTPPDVTSSSHGKTLVVTVGGAGGSSMIPFAAAASTSFTIDYPGSMKLDLRVSTGGIRIDKPPAFVQIYSGDGDVTVDSPRAGVTAQAAHGVVSVTSAMGSVDLASDLGDVSAGLAPGWRGNEIRMQAAQGAIALNVPAGFRAKLDVTSGTGNVHNELGKSNASKPLVWLYAPAGDVSITVAH